VVEPALGGGGRGGGGGGRASSSDRKKRRSLPSFSSGININFNKKGFHKENLKVLKNQKYSGNLSIGKQIYGNQIDVITQAVHRFKDILTILH